MDKFEKENPTNLEKYRTDKAHQEMETRVYSTLDHVRERGKVASKNFLEVWKKSVKLVDTEFFNIKSDTVDDATDKWQLAPNLKFIQKASEDYSHGTRVLSALMYSFYDSEEGHKLLEHFGTPNFVDALGALDFEGAENIVTLGSNHSDW